MFKGIAFDLDGIITDTAHYHFIAWKQLASELGISIDEQFNERLKGVSREESLRRILEYGGILNKVSETEFKSLTDKKNDDYVALIQSITEKDLLPGIKNFLEKCKEANIKMIIASASKNAPAILNNLGVSDYFLGIVDPSQLKNSKPDPEIFIKAAELAELDVSEMVGIEDAEAGVTAINSANMFSVGIGDYESLKHADLYLESTDQLSIEKINNAIRNEKNI